MIDYCVTYPLFTMTSSINLIKKKVSGKAKKISSMEDDLLLLLALHQQELAKNLKNPNDVMSKHNTG